MVFHSSYLSKDGELLNLTWNDTFNANPMDSSANNIDSIEVDDAAWVMSSTIMIFGKG